MITSQRIIAEVKKDKVYPVYLLMGEEREDKRLLIELIMDSLRKKSDNIEKYTFYGDELEMSKLLTELQTYSFFDDIKVIIVKDVEKIAFSESFFSYLGNPNDRSILILLTDKNDVSKKLQKAVEGKGRVVKFWRNFQDKIEYWLLSELKSRGIKTDIEAVRYIIESTGNQKEDILNQIDTISNYLKEGDYLDIDGLKRIISRTIKYNVFDLINSIFIKNPIELIRIFRGLIGYGEDLTRINFFFWKYLKTLMVASSYRNMGYSNDKIISSLNLRKLESVRIIKIISHFSIDYLNMVMNRLEKIDYYLKTRPKYLSILMFEELLLSLKKI